MGWYTIRRHPIRQNLPRMSTNEILSFQIRGPSTTYSAFSGTLGRDHLRFYCRDSEIFQLRHSFCGRESFHHEYENYSESNICYSRRNRCPISRPCLSTSWL